jgi:hypothetical protein
MDHGLSMSRLSLGHCAGGPSICPIHVWTTYKYSVTGLAPFIALKAGNLAITLVVVRVDASRWLQQWLQNLKDG